MNLSFNKSPAYYTILIIFSVLFLNGFYITWIFQTNLVVAWTHDVFQFLLLPFTLFYVLHKRYNITPRCYGISFPKNKYDGNALLINTIWCTVTIIIFYESTKALFKQFIADIPFEGYFNLIPSGYLEIPVIIYLSITAAIVEEITFRGLPLFAFQKYNTQKHFNSTYVVITSILFSMIHWEQGIPDLAATFVFGVLSAMFYLRFKNLVPIIIAHFIGDLVSFW